MKFVVQRVSEASVAVEGKKEASICRGMVVFLGIHRDDRLEDCPRWVEKLLKLRIFPDESKPINRSVQDIDGEILLVSQFTLYGDARGQNRPSFLQAAPPDQAKPIYQYFVDLLAAKWPKTKTGTFASEMKVSLVNDGPVTIILE